MEMTGVRIKKNQATRKFARTRRCLPRAIALDDNSGVVKNPTTLLKIAEGSTMRKECGSPENKPPKHKSRDLHNTLSRSAAFTPLFLSQQRQNSRSINNGSFLTEVRIPTLNDPGSFSFLSHFWEPEKRCASM
jgi:hypothetical protein